MKRMMGVWLAVALLLIMNVACSDEAFTIPQYAEEIGQQLEELPTLKTKQSGETITVQVSGPVDYLLANWQGYMEQPEEIELTDGTGIVEAKGHKYQLGARWNNDLHYIMVENFFRYEDASDEELRSYFDALVEYGDARVTGKDPVEVIIRHLIPEYRTRKTVETFNAKTGETTKEAVVLKTTPINQVSDDELQQMIEELPDDTHEEFEDGSYSNTWYAISESACKVLEYTIGMDSNGAPDRAYLATSGDYVLAWGRSGVLKTATKILRNHDCFETGIVGATSYIIWNNGDTDLPTYISDVVTYYPEGSKIASINAEYSHTGALRKATATYTDGHTLLLGVYSNALGGWADPNGLKITEDVQTVTTDVKQGEEVIVELWDSVTADRSVIITVCFDGYHVEQACNMTVKFADCVENGEVAKSQCTLCETFLRTEMVPALGHEKDQEMKTIKEATCVEAGLEGHLCKRCGEIVDMQETKALGHVEGKPVVAKEASCEKERTSEVRCERCGEVLDTQEIKALGHVEGKAVVAKTATCLAEGITEVRCERCGEVLSSEKTPKTDHVPGRFVPYKEATCTTEGTMAQYCDVCGTLLETSKVPALGHTPGKWEVVREATETTDGLTEQKCTACGEVLQTQTIQATGK